MLAPAGALALGIAAGAPAAAGAHGPVAPVALDYLARVHQSPPGLEAKVIDGDQRLWLRAPATVTVVVLDYRGAPYLRFSRTGVEVNRNSAMYYLNQTPVAQTPPANLGPATPPRWQRVTAGHTYDWHDGRLHALASVARLPGVSFLGTWRIPVLVGGQPGAISGGLRHADPPSPVWFWPIVVLLLCVVAAWRVRNPRLDVLSARLLAVAALVAVAVAAIGLNLHGRPAVSVLQLILLALVLAFVAWGLHRVTVQRPGFFSYFVIAIVAVWQGIELIPTLVYGFVLIAEPAFVARAACVTALGSALGLMLLMFRISDLQEQTSPKRPTAPLELERDDGAWELA